MSDDQDSMKRKAISISADSPPPLVSLSDEMIGKVLSYLKFDDGAVQLKQACTKFSSIPIKFFLDHSCVDQHVFEKSLSHYTGRSARGRDIQDVIRDKPGIKDIPNCGHCDHTNRFEIRICGNGRYQGTLDHAIAYECKECSEHYNTCYVCDNSACPACEYTIHGRCDQCGRQVCDNSVRECCYSRCFECNYVLCNECKEYGSFGGNEDCHSCRKRRERMTDDDFDY